jgi:hypothetical protein
VFQLTLLKNIDSFVSYDIFSFPTLKNHISQTTRDFLTKSAGTPFKNHVLELVKFQQGKSSKKKGGLTWFGTVGGVTACHGMPKRVKPCQPPFPYNFSQAEILSMLKHYFKKVF